MATIAGHAVPIGARQGPPGEPPPLVGPLEAVLRHRALFLAPIVALLALGAALGLLRHPVYTAETRLNVGRVDVPSYVLQGVILGNQALAESYARAIDAEQVFLPAALKVGVNPFTARDHLQASPIPNSTLIRVDATDTQSLRAVALANAAGDALVTYTTTLNRDPGTANLLGRYEAAETTVVRARDRMRAVQAHFGSKSSAPAQAAVAKASVALQAAQLQAADLSDRYRASSQGQLPANLVQVVVSATTATSDFVPKLELLLFVGAAAGALVGCALALMRANRERRHLLA